MRSQLFQKLKKFASARRQYLPFIQSIEDVDVLIAIGEAYERGMPLGFKQLALLDLAPPSTLQRRLKRLVADRVIRKYMLRDDGRCIAYTPTRKTLEAFYRFTNGAFAEK
jgi:DNA-binding MarR family transcriptional regulator